MKDLSGSVRQRVGQPKPSGSVQRVGQPQSVPFSRASGVARTNHQSVDRREDHTGNLRRLNAESGTELQAAGLLEGEAVLDLAEVELLLDFADWMLSHAASVWASASWANKIRIQRAIFPAGLVVSQEGFGTPEEQCAFFRLQENSRAEYDLASPGGFEPPLPP